MAGQELSGFVLGMPLPITCPTFCRWGWEPKSYGYLSEWIQIIWFPFIRTPINILQKVISIRHFKTPQRLVIDKININLTLRLW